MDARGHSVGLGILWDPTLVSLGGFQGTQYPLSTEFKVVGFPILGIVMNVYGPHHAGENREFLHSLRIIKE